MSDNAQASFDPSAMLYGNLDKSPTDFAAAFSAGSKQVSPPAGSLLPDPDDSAGQDPASPIPATDPGTYELQPDSAVTAAPTEAAPAVDEPAQPVPEPVDLTPLFTQGLEDYNAIALAAQEAAQTLADLQGNAEGIAEFTPEMSDAMQAKMKAEANAERAFDEIADDSITLAIQNFPELADDNHPATISVKSILEANPELASRTPTAVAELSVRIASQIRAKAPGQVPKPAPQPVSQPQPTPGPVPARAPAPASAMSSHANAQRPVPGQSATPDIVAQVRAAAAKEGGLAGLFNSVLGNSNSSGNIRMS
jgi:hypothetical protein